MTAMKSKMITAKARRDQIVEMRKNGMQFTAIAKALGISSGRVGQLHREATRKAQDPIEALHVRTFGDLPTRAVNALKSGGYSTKQQVRDDALSGKLKPGCGLPEYGKQSHADVLDWLGISAKPDAKTLDQYTRYLERHGYTVIPPKSD